MNRDLKTTMQSHGGFFITLVITPSKKQSSEQINAQSFMI